MARALCSRTAAGLLARRLVGGGQAAAGRLGRRAHHTRRPVVLEVDGASTASSAEGASALKRRLEEAIDGAMARMSEPEWAPFRPGTSYFAPPRPAGAALGLLELVTRGGGIGMLPPPPPRGLSDEEARAVAFSSRGYPCSTYFVDGCFSDEAEGSNQDAADPAEEE
ncbi:uncharacterized protein LOC100826206 [Brachypodium distachyon]|uniref:Uncharacterized protein n=1 Tax=Brachypodium distachyon TaxID=15368 RepID=I1GVT5_BRADI|nr:uncharacterized protein LOC100826206 [Brachypodium distachyon]KQK16953.1 hypothetical protein BRADI_1g31630v3 [Brachypodium distachyon]|eukprot:XP_003563370.1 uncharacterized protein LOC100826206 [Brachypodium distachyon]